MDTVWLDVRYAMRTLVKRPGFFAVAVVTLALGAGANTAIFSVVNTVLLRPLPYPGGDRIVRIVQHRPASAASGGLPGRLAALSTDDLQAWRSRSRTLSQMAAYGPAAMTMAGREEPVRLAAARVSPALFPLLGVAPLKGRTFEPGEERPGADAEVVLSFTAWQKYFAADPDILARTLLLDDRGYSVVGVMPRGFEFPDAGTEVWVPFVLTPPVRTPGERMVQLVQVIARVKAGVAMTAAQSEANVVFRQLREEEARADAQDFGRARGSGAPVGRGGAGPVAIEPGGGRVVRGGPEPGMRGGDVPVRRGGPGRGDLPRDGLFGGPGAATVELSPLKDELVRPVRPALIVLVVSVGFVLLIACANVANLLLARAAGRRQEIAVRAALGASRGRLIRQTLTESLVLAFIGSALGAALAWGAERTLRGAGPADIPRLDQLHLDLPFFAFTIGIAVVTGILFGVVPALRLARADEMHAIKQGAAYQASGLSLLGRNRTRSVLAIVEIALAMVLLVGAGLLINSFLKLSNVNPGYDPTNVLAFQVSLPQARYETAQREAFYRQMLDRLRALPGVRAAAISNTLPLQQGIIRIGLRIFGRPEPTRPEDFTIADVRVISADYPTTMGIRLVEGRAVRAEDGANPPQEVLVNQSFARKYLGGRAVGERLNFNGPAPWEIVGVVNDVRHAGLTAEPFPELYVDYRQATTVMPRGLRDVFFTVRTAQSPLPLATSVRGLVRQLDPQLIVDNMATMEQRLSDSVAGPRFYATLVGVFACIALVLASVGIYGVLSYAVSQCTREIGIRLALGAPRRGVLRLVLGQGCLVAAIGIGVGLAGAALVTRSLSTLLFDLTPLDPATFTAVSAVLAAVAIAACYVPARRAMRVDPIAALRAE